MAAQDDPNTLLLLGEIRGQLREMIHTQNNNSAKLDAMTLRIGTLEQVVPAVAAIDVRLGKVETQMTTLNTEKDRRGGALGLVDWVARNWGVIIGFAALILIILRQGGVLQ